MSPNEKQKDEFAYRDEASEFFDYPPTLFILVILAGAAGAWVKELRAVIT